MLIQTDSILFSQYLNIFGENFDREAMSCSCNVRIFAKKRGLIFPNYNKIQFVKTVP